MMQGVFVFIIFLGPMVFFHELGHFLFARFFGVRVEVFSIGFGPKIFKYKRNFTEYCVSIIPLGGYVKMFGDDPLKMDQIDEVDRKNSFTHKGKWARFWIVAGGPLANFIMAYVIFSLLFMVGEKVPELRLGIVPVSNSYYAQGFRTGDTILKINGAEPFSIEGAASEDEMIKTVTVKRQDVSHVININTPASEFVGIFKISSPLRKPFLVDANGNIFALSNLADTRETKLSLDEMASMNIHQYYLFDMKNPTESKMLKSINIPAEVNTAQSFFKYLSDTQGLRPKDLLIKSVLVGDPAEKAGVLGGDIILSFQGKDVFQFEDLRKNLQLSKSKTVTIKVWRKGEILDFNIIPKVVEQGSSKVKLVGVISNGDMLAINFKEANSKGFFTSLGLAFGRTWKGMVQVLRGYKKLITAEVSFKNVGGPLAIGKVATDSFNMSLSYFFRLMALVSLNLGIINLFPIPVLDGGHIMFIFLELVNGGPVSRRKMELAQQIGLSLLLLLMVGALFNDFTNFLM